MFSPSPPGLEASGLRPVAAPVCVPPPDVRVEPLPVPLCVPDPPDGRSAFLGRDPTIIQNTGVDADGRGGVVFAGMTGGDSIFAFDYSGRLLASGPVDPVQPVPTVHALLAAAGVKYIGDWVYDDEPTVIKTTKGPLVTLPYTIECNDIPVMIIQHHNSDYLLQMVKDQFDRLYLEGADNARVMAISIHPYITGVPHRIKYLEALLDYVIGHDGVALMTASEIGDQPQLRMISGALFFGWLTDRFGRRRLFFITLIVYTLATIATMTPFIGLFGTVIGLINAFHGMALTGSGGIGAVSAGIAEALVETALDPPESPDPAPRGTTGTPWRAAQRTASCGPSRWARTRTAWASQPGTSEVIRNR